MRAWVVVLLTAGCRLRFDAIDTTDGDATAAPVTYREAVLADHPLSYWRFDGTTTAISDVQQNVDGLFSGGCTFGAAGALAQDTDTAVHFDGINCKGSFGDNFRFPGTAAFTIEMWVHPSRALAYEHYFTLELRATAAPTEGYALFRDNGPIGVMAERVVAMTNFKTIPFEITANTWTHLVMVYDGAFIQLYVDGVLVEQQADTQAMNVAGAILLIGAHSQGAQFMGELDEVAVYGEALPQARLALHHKIGVDGPQ